MMLPARLLALALVLPAPASVLVAQHEVQITEWPVPYKMNEAGEILDGEPAAAREGTRPRDPYVDGMGRVWFCGQQGNYIARLDPATGRFKRYALPPSANPHNLIVDESGFVWYAGNQGSHIGKLNPQTGEITQYPMPDPEVRDPHTLVFDGQGHIWFTAQQSNAVGRLHMESGRVELIKVPTPRARPYGIKLDSQGHPWIVLFGTNKVATVDPATMRLREFELPRAETRPRRIEITPDDMIWYVDYAGGVLGRFDPKTGDVREWPTPGGPESRPYGTALDDKGRIWFVESVRGQPSQLVGFDTHSLEFLGGTELESGGLTVRYMYFHRPSREIWFGTDANTIGRARVP